MFFFLHAPQAWSFLVNWEPSSSRDACMLPETTTAMDKLLAFIDGTGKIDSEPTLNQDHD